MKHLSSILFLLLASVCAFANDGVYYTSGNVLVPMRENTISVRKEILTITIGKENMAKVDVYYEFYNPDSTKTVAMAFEAAAPYNDADFDIGKSHEHPHIHDFKVVMNDQPLRYRNMLIDSEWKNNIDQDITPLDLTEWKHEMPKKYDEYLWPDMLYSARLDSFISADYGYMFEATFKPGINTVHHTYNYKMSFSIGDKYSIHYWLTPATRWANRQIDDFTLRIKNENDMDFAISNDSIFMASQFVITQGKGVVYPFTKQYHGHCTLAVLHGEGAVLEWHANGFAPKSDMLIESIDYFISTLSPYGATQGEVVTTTDGKQSRYIGDSGDSYLVLAQDYGLIPKSDAKVDTLYAENGQGIITIRNKKYKSVNIRKEPTTKSAVIATVRDTRGELPVVMKCLGLVRGGVDMDYYWFKVEVNGKVGFVREDIVIWDTIDTY